MKIQWVAYSEGQPHKELNDYVKQHKSANVKWFSKLEGLQGELVSSQEVVLFIYSGSTYDVYDLSRSLTLQYPSLSVILVMPISKIDLKQAMYAGAVDVISVSLLDSEINQAVENAEALISQKMRRRETEAGIKKDGKIFAVCSTKGGVGKTTLSVNLGAAIAKANLRVAVLDLDLQFGDVAIIFDAQPRKTIYDWIKESFEHGDGSLDAYMTRHSTGVDILAAPFLPEYAELVTGEHVQFILTQLREMYDVILIDTPPSLVETVIVGMENADEILLITALDLPTLKNGKLAIETLTLLNLRDKIKVVLNRDAEIEGMKTDTVESILGMSIHSRVPSDYKVVISSLNRGIPFVISNPRSLVARSVFTIADKLVVKEKKVVAAVPTHTKEAHKRPFLKRLMFKSKAN